MLFSVPQFPVTSALLLNRGYQSSLVVPQEPPQLHHGNCLVFLQYSPCNQGKTGFLRWGPMVNGQIRRSTTPVGVTHKQPVGLHNLIGAESVSWSTIYVNTLIPFKRHLCRCLARRIKKRGSIRRQFHPAKCN